MAERRQQSPSATGKLNKKIGTVGSVSILFLFKQFIFENFCCILIGQTGKVVNRDG